MDSILRDGLCIVGVFYLLVHLWHSIDSIRKGVGNLIKHATRFGPDHGQHIPGSHARPAVGAGRTRQEELSHRWLDRF
jgi:hypothetical protein